MIHPTTRAVIVKEQMVGTHNKRHRFHNGLTILGRQNVIKFNEQKCKKQLLSNKCMLTLETRCIPIYISNLPVPTLA